jgi:hypothetical protein
MGSFTHNGKEYRVQRVGHTFIVEIDARMPWEPGPMWQRFADGECNDAGTIAWWTGGYLPVEPIEVLLREQGL